MACQSLKQPQREGPATDAAAGQTERCLFLRMEVVVDGGQPNDVQPLNRFGEGILQQQTVEVGDIVVLKRFGGRP